ncbi:MAG: 1,2-phenylacetyl-CoA epoxidase subunit PaaC [Rhodospirillales bacterium]
MAETADPRFEYLLRLGDNALVLSHRLSEWCGHGPVLEEDLALTNVALDLIGQAQFWLGYAGELEGRGRDADALAYRRDVWDFRNVLLVEQPNGDYAQTMARQFYFDAWHVLALSALTDSRDARIAEIAAKAVKEAKYHLDRSALWVVTLGDGTEESHDRMQRAIDDLWSYTGELFEVDAVEASLVAEGVAPDLAGLVEPWRASVGDTLRKGTLELPEAAWMHSGGKKGVHSESLGYILAEMQFLQRAYPGASW